MQATCENYRSIFDYANDAIFVLDADTGAVVDVNNKMLELYGVSLEEARNSDFGSLGAGQYPYDHEGALQRIRQAAIGQDQLFEWLAKDRFGGLFWIEVNLKRAIIGGLLRILAVARDISRRKRMEQRLALQYTVTGALTQAADLDAAMPGVLQAICEHVGWDLGEVWFLDDVSKTLKLGSVWHAARDEFAHFIDATRAVTFSPGDGLPGRVCAEGCPHWVTDVADDPHFLRTTAAAAAGLHAAFAFPFKSAGSMLGTMAFFSSSVKPPDEDLLRMFDALGTQIGDFIRRKRAEEDLRRKAVELERSNKELQVFAYVASHDLQEPLRVITGFAQLIERRYRGRLDEKADGYIDFIVDGARRMQQLVSDLLAYSRVARGEPARNTVDCSKVLEGALKNLQSAIEESGAVITADALPVVTGDESQLISLFQNLIGNALKYRGRKTPAVHVSSRRMSESSELNRPGWQFSVKDNGIGMSAEHFDRIFQPFQRLHTRAEYPGTGIGLAICKKIVERRGGRIWVSSEQDQGSTFFFLIPD